VRAWYAAYRAGVLVEDAALGGEVRVADLAEEVEETHRRSYGGVSATGEGWPPRLTPLRAAG